MRHFAAHTLAVSPLPGGVAVRAATGALIARARPPGALAPAQPRARCGAVHIAVIAAPADPNLHGTARTVVEPIARLPEHAQCPSPKHWTAPGSGRHKGPAHCLLRALRMEGPG